MAESKLGAQAKDRRYSVPDVPTMLVKKPMMVTTSGRMRPVMKLWNKKEFCATEWDLNKKLQRYVYDGCGNGQEEEREEGETKGSESFREEGRGCVYSCRPWP